MSLQVNNPLIQPSGIWHSVIPNDTTVLTEVKTVYVGVTGDVTCIDYSGSTVTFTAVPTGTFMPIAPSIIKATGTTATNLVILQ